MSWIKTLFLWNLQPPLCGACWLCKAASTCKIKSDFIHEAPSADGVRLQRTQTRNTKRFKTHFPHRNGKNKISAEWILPRTLCVCVCVREIIWYRDTQSDSNPKKHFDATVLLYSDYFHCKDWCCLLLSNRHLGESITPQIAALYIWT